MTDLKPLSQEECENLYNWGISAYGESIVTREDMLRALHTIDLLEQALADSENNLQMQVAYTKELEERQARLVEALKDTLHRQHGLEYAISHGCNCLGCRALREIGERE